MALRRLLSNQLKLSVQAKGQFIRSGHGWDRPDVPTEIIPEYIHKREISIFDINMWAYDQVFPEYMISNNEVHLGSLASGIKESLSQAGYIWVILGCIGGFYYLNSNKRQFGWDTNDTQGRINEYNNQYKKRSGYRGNFLGLEITGENAIIHPVYERANGLRGTIDDLSAGVSQRKIINTEAKNFVEKVRKDCEQRLLNHGQPAKHHH